MTRRTSHPTPRRAAALALLVGVAAATHAATARADWVGAWSASPSDAATSQPLDRQTLRMVVHPHLGGSAARVRLSNRFGAEPVVLGPATLATRAAGAAVVAGSSRALTFAGSPTVTIPAGGEVTSDPVDLPVAASGDLAVSLAVPGRVPAPTEHAITRQTNYLSPAGSGDATQDEAGAGFQAITAGGRSTGWFFLSGVDVDAPAGSSAVVAFGDSLTDGLQGRPDGTEDLTAVDANARYPDALARRLAAMGAPTSVLNAGIGGNRLLRDGYFPSYGPAGLGRFASDALGLPGASTVVVLQGINDVLQTPASSADVIAGLRALVAAGHAAGERVVLGTLTPIAGFGSPPITASSAFEATRQEVNRWIRTQAEADGVADFDAAVRDPARPSALRPSYDGGDHIHLAPAGYDAMAAVAQTAVAPLLPVPQPEPPADPDPSTTTTTTTTPRTTSTAQVPPTVPTTPVPPPTTAPGPPVAAPVPAHVTLTARARQRRSRPVALTLAATGTGRVLVVGRATARGRTVRVARRITLVAGVPRTVHLTTSRAALARLARAGGRAPRLRVTVTGVGRAVTRTVTLVA